MLCCDIFSNSGRGRWIGLDLTGYRIGLSVVQSYAGGRTEGGTEIANRDKESAWEHFKFIGQILSQSSLVFELGPLSSRGL